MRSWELTLTDEPVELFDEGTIVCVVQGAHKDLLELNPAHLAHNDVAIHLNCAFQAVQVEENTTKRI